MNRANREQQGDGDWQRTRALNSAGRAAEMWIVPFVGNEAIDATDVPTVKVRELCKDGALGRCMSVKQLALSLPKHAWRTITWRAHARKRRR